MADIKQMIKDKGLSFTKPREAILKALILEHGPFTAEEIFQKLQQDTCDQATLFRTLKQFKEKGLVSTTHMSDGVTRYEFNDPKHHHHHVSCRVCGKIETIHHCSLGEIEKSVKAMGFSSLSHRLEFEGVCQDCKSSK